MKIKKIKNIFLTKRSKCRYLNSRAGTTLVELVAVVAILAVISSTGIGAMFNMTKICRVGQNISFTQQNFELFNSQIMAYMNTASSFGVKFSQTSMLYDSSNYKYAPLSGYQDAQNCTSDNLVTYFIAASPTEKDTIELLKMDKSKSDGYTYDHAKIISKLSGIEKIEFTLVELDYGIGESRALVKYTIYSTSGYKISSGMVMDNYNYLSPSTFISDSPEGTDNKITIYCSDKSQAQAINDFSSTYSDVVDPTSSTFNPKYNVFSFNTTNRQEVDIF